jgi:hypothetical protein
MEIYDERGNQMTTDYQPGFMDYVRDPLDLLGHRAGQSAAAQQAQAMERANAFAQGSIDQNRADLQQREAAGVAGLQQGAAGAIDSYRQGGSLADTYLNNGYNRAGAAVNTGYGAAQNTIAGLQRERGPQAYDVNGQFAGQMDRMQQQQGGLAGIANQAQMDPGMQFRQQQGEQAISRQAAAAGGRASPRTMKAMAEFNSGLASQEYGNAYNRALATQGQAFGQQAQIAGMGLSSLANQAGREDAMGQYNRQRLDSLGTTRAGMSVDSGRGLADIYAGQGQALAGNAWNTNSAVGGMQYGSAQDIAGLGTTYGGMQTDLTGQAINSQWQASGAGGMTDQAAANARGGMAGTIGGIIGGIFGSDESIKTDVRDGSGMVRDMLDELDPLAYRYIDIAYGDGERLGVMAQDLERSAAGALAVVDVGGVKMVDATSAVSLLLAAVAHLNKRIAVLEGGA